MASFLRNNIPEEIQIKVKELLEVLNKKSQNNIEVSDLNIIVDSKMIQHDILITDYEINLRTILLKDKENI